MLIFSFEKTSFEGFTFDKSILIWPFLHASVAKLRVLK